MDMDIMTPQVHCAGVHYCLQRVPWMRNGCDKSVIADELEMRTGYEDGRKKINKKITY